MEKEMNDAVYDDIQLSFARHSFDAQAIIIWNAVRLSSSEREDLQILHNDIRRTLQTIWPGCGIKIFGSLVTGLAFRDSDMDVYVELPPHCRGRDTDHYLIEIKAYVAHRESNFEYVFAAHLAKVPVITFKHVESNRNCDITFTGSVTVETNKLIRFLLRLDSRAFKLAWLIKYWSKLYKLTATKRLSNYAVTLLVVFFLQQKKILPSVATLQKNMSLNDTEGWNTAFKHVKCEYRDEYSLYHLLGDFFLYYSTFNYKDFVVCSYLGYPVKKQKFFNPLLLPDEFKLYKARVRNGDESFRLTTSLCVQDPFEHNKNCTINVDVVLAWKVYMCFNNAADCYNNSPSYGFLKNLVSKAHRDMQPSIPAYKLDKIQFTLTDNQIPQKGRSLKFYFCTAVCLLTLYTFLSS